MEEEEATGAAAVSPGASDGATLAAAAARRLERVSLIYAEAGWAAERTGRRAATAAAAWAAAATVAEVRGPKFSAVVRRLTAPRARSVPPFFFNTDRCSVVYLTQQISMAAVVGDA